MHLLYLDESGSVPDKCQEYFVLAGVSVSETRTHWVEQALNNIAKRFAPNNPYDIELHGSPMRSGREGWKAYSHDARIIAIKDSLKEGIALQRSGCVRVFGVVIRKNALVGVDPVEYAFESLVKRFDLYLGRNNRKYRDKKQHRGLIVFDKSSTERRIQNLAIEFKYNGHAHGKTKNFAEVPVFLDSKASRLIQLADLVAFSMFRKFEHNDPQFYDIISPSFDSEGGTVHGLEVVN